MKRKEKKKMALRNLSVGFVLTAAIVALLGVSLGPAIAQTTITTRVTTAKLSGRDASAQPAPGTANATASKISLGFTGLVDGAGQMNTGVAVPLYTVLGTAGRLKIVSITGVGVTAGTAGNVYTGTGVSYLLWWNGAGMSVNVLAGWKGFNLNNGFQLDHGAANAILGFGITIPIGSP